MRGIGVGIVLLLVLWMIAGCRTGDNSTGTTIEKATITGITPNQVNPGQEKIEGRIFGSNLSGIFAVGLGNGITVYQFTPIGNSELYIFFSVSHDAVPGPRDITLSTTAGGVSASSLLSVGNNRFPEPIFTVHPGRGYLDTEFRFDASRSKDDGKIVQYKWRFGDGRTDTGKIVKHKYKKSGLYDVTLTVKDNQNLTSDDTRLIDVDPSRPPVARFTMNPLSGDTNTTFHFDASASSDPDGHIIQYLWAFGDGTNDHGITTSHRFSSGGGKPVTLTVTDNTGAYEFATQIADVKGGTGGGTTPPPGTPPPGTGSGTRCTSPVPKGQDWYGTILSTDRAAGTVVVQLYQNANCSDVYYYCGDIRLGGDPNPPEYWLGTICEMYDLGNNTFRVKLVRGNFWPDPGQSNVYFHWQDCSGGFCP